MSFVLLSGFRIQHTHNYTFDSLTFVMFGNVCKIEQLTQILFVVFSFVDSLQFWIFKILKSWNYGHIFFGVVQMAFESVNQPMKLLTFDILKCWRNTHETLTCEHLSIQCFLHCEISKCWGKHVLLKVWSFKMFHFWQFDHLIFYF